MEQARDLTISGLGSTNGGHVRKAKIDGIGRIDGDLVCEQLIANGKADFSGNVEATMCEINGTSTVEMSFRAAKLKVNGSLKVGGDMACDDIVVAGHMKVLGSCQAETFRSNGKIKLGTLNAGSMNISVQGQSSIGEIGGAAIEVMKPSRADSRKWLKWIGIDVGDRLTAELIEGDDIYLEYTTAAVVRGQRVKLGPGCEIGTVEYRDYYERHAASKVETDLHI